MSHEQVIEWLVREKFDTSVIDRFVEWKIDGIQLWSNIGNASIFLYNVGIVQSTLRDAILQNIYLELLQKIPGFDERYMGEFEHLSLIANGPISTVYKADIMPRYFTFSHQHSTVVIKGYHFTANNIKVGKIIQILVHLISNISSELFVKVHGFIRNMQDFSSYSIRIDSESIPEGKDLDEGLTPETSDSLHVKQPMFGIVMEYVDGGSIRSLYDKQMNDQFSIVEKVEILIDFASAVCYSLHEKGYVHRNLKASNVLIKASDGSVKLTDYCMDITQITNVSFATKQSERSLRWLAPELLLNNNVVYSKKSDVYAFGITMYEILSGCRPYHKYTKTDLLIEQILNGLRPDLDDVIYFAQPLVELMVQCWTEDPKQRPEFKTIVETLEDIRDHEWNKKKTFNDCIISMEQIRNSQLLRLKKSRSMPRLKWGKKQQNVNNVFARDDSALELELKARK